MDVLIVQQGDNKVAAYAREELERCLKLMDPTMKFSKGDMVINLSIKEDGQKRDHISISDCDNTVTVQGNTPCALLIATYRLLYELGCRWTVMGKDGEHIPRRDLRRTDFNIAIDETASYRLRGVMIEGAASEENLRDMIEYLPRIGMNTYFIQFHVPYYFLNSWYQHVSNPLLEKEDFDEERAKEILGRLDDEISKRGIEHHAVGHGWTCVPFGIPNLGWEEYTGELPEGYLEMTAMVNGKRGLHGGQPINTNLCYSQSKVRETIASGVADFCERNPQVDAVHIYLADNINSSCECDECRKMTHCDWYVQIVNEIDDKLTERKLPTKVVFELYQDSLWTPEKTRLNKSDRFILTFAPFNRTYSTPLNDGKSEYGLSGHDKWELNKIRLPENVDVNLSFLREWQQIFSGDSFIIDYHLMWDHCFDPGYMDCARGIYADIKNLYRMNMDGFMSCQLTRTGFPTNLPLYTLGKSLWNRNLDFDSIANEYFETEFGAKAGEVRAYLEELTRRFDPRYLRGEVDIVDHEREKEFLSIPGIVTEFRINHPEMRHDSENMSWRVLAVHSDTVIMLALMLARKASGQDCHDMGDTIRTYVRSNEMLIQSRLDVRNYTDKVYMQFLFKQES